jgi:hypothetical protein
MQAYAWQLAAARFAVVKRQQQRQLMALRLEVRNAACVSLQQHVQLCYNASSSWRQQQPVGCDAEQCHVLLCCVVAQQPWFGCALQSSGANCSLSSRRCVRHVSQAEQAMTHSLYACV